MTTQPTSDVLCLSPASRPRFCVYLSDTAEEPIYNSHSFTVSFDMFRTLQHRWKGLREPELWVEWTDGTRKKLIV